MIFSACQKESSRVEESSSIHELNTTNSSINTSSSIVDTTNLSLPFCFNYTEEPGGVLHTETINGITYTEYFLKKSMELYSEPMDSDQRSTYLFSKIVINSPNVGDTTLYALYTTLDLSMPEPFSIHEVINGPVYLYNSDGSLYNYLVFVDGILAYSYNNQNLSLGNIREGLIDNRNPIPCFEELHITTYTAHFTDWYFYNPDTDLFDIFSETSMKIEIDSRIIYTAVPCSTGQGNDIRYKETYLSIHDRRNIEPKINEGIRVFKPCDPFDPTTEDIIRPLIKGEDGNPITNSGDLEDIIDNSPQIINATDFSNYEFPCGDIPNDEILNDIISQMEDEGDCSQERFNELLDGVDVIEGIDKVDVDPQIAALCPNLACILENMQNGALGTSLVCNAFNFFEGDNSQTDLNISLLSFSSVPSILNSGLAFTNTDVFSGDTEITINLDNCGGNNMLNIFETIQHELIHASIQTALIRQFGYSYTGNSYQEAMQLLLNETYGPNPTDAEHRLMLDRFLLPLVASLIEMNGGGLYSDFVGLVLNGFPPEILEAAGYNLGDVISLALDSKAHINDPTNIINETLLGCE